MTSDSKYLRESRKYKIGTIHEIASGKFEIIDRYLAEDGHIMLKYKMLETGEVIDNREVNVASNLYKFRMKRKMDLLKGEATFEDLVGITPEHSYKAIMEELKAINEQLRLLSIKQADMLKMLEEK